MKKLILLLIIILLSTQVLADLENYPDFFSKDKTIQSVKGAKQSSKHIQASLNIFYSLPEEIRTSNYENRLDLKGEVKDFETNFILIGGPCQNSITKHFFPGEDCFLGLNNGQTLIKLKENNKQKILLIVSGSDDSLLKTTESIRNNPDFFKGIKENEIMIESNGNMKKVKMTEETSKDSVKQIKKLDCKGCAVDGNCIEKLSLTSINGKPHFCSEELNLIPQKELEEECQNNYECIQNRCKKNKCKEQSIFTKFTNWIKSLI